MKWFSPYNLLLINYGVSWMLMSTNYSTGITFFLLVWAGVALFKVLKIIFINKIIFLALLIVSFFIPGIQFITSLLLLLYSIYRIIMIIAEIFENWLLIILGLFLFYVLLRYSPDTYFYFRNSFSEAASVFFCLLTGLGLAFSTTFVLRKLGYERKKIEDILLSLPAYLVILTFSFFKLTGMNKD